MTRLLLMMRLVLLPSSQSTAEPGSLQSYIIHQGWRQCEYLHFGIQCRISLLRVIWRPPEAASYWSSQPRTSTNGASIWKSMYRFDISQRQGDLHRIFHLPSMFVCVNEPGDCKFVTLKASFLNSLKIPKSGNDQVSHFLEFTQQLAHQEFETSHNNILQWP